MKVVVTGGAGFIGANLCSLLCTDERIDQVVAVDDLSTGFAENLAGIDTTLMEGTILDQSLLDEAFEGAGSIVHLGARGSVPLSVADPVASHEANASGTVQVLEAARRAGNTQVILASSSSVYGANPQLPKTESMVPRPVSPYAASKLATESYAIAWQHSYGLPVLAFRFFNVFGPMQSLTHPYAAVVPMFVSAALDGRPLPVHGDGTQSRDFTYVGTVCDILARAAIDGTTSETPVNLAFGTRTSLLELIEMMEDILGEPLEREHQPRRAGDVDHTQADNQLLQDLFPGAEAVELRDALEETISWYRSNS